MRDLGITVSEFPQRGELPEITDPSVQLAVPYIEYLFLRLDQLGEGAFEAGSEAFKALKACEDGAGEWVVARIERVAASGTDHLCLFFDVGEKVRRLAAATGADDFESFVARHRGPPASAMYASFDPQADHVVRQLTDYVRDHLAALGRVGGGGDHA